MDDRAYRKRLIWFAALVRDVMATLGSDAGRVWLGRHHSAIRENLATVQREWNDEKRNLRPASPDAGATTEGEGE